MDKVINPSLPRLYSRRSDGKIQSWQIFVKDSAYYTVSGIIDGAKVTSSPTQCEAKRNYTPALQAEREARALWKKQQDSGYCTSIDEIDKPKFFAPMLAHVWEDYHELVEQAFASGLPVYCQPKLDGMRCIAQGDGLTSRNGKAIVSAPHIHASVRKLMHEQHMDGFCTDGELYTHKLAKDFNQIISLAKKTKPTAADLAASAEHLQYHIYDLPSHSGVFSDRYFELKSLLVHRPPWIVLVETVMVNSVDRIQELFGRWRGEGYEGAMVRLDQPYEQKRSRGLLKYKVFQEEEYTILDVLEGKGNRAGMAGAMEFATAAGKHFTAAIMGNVSLFKEMLFDRDSLLGKVATVQFFNYTPDGLPRFPYVKAIRGYD